MNAHSNGKANLDGSVRFTFVHEAGRMIDCTTSSPLINHFLDLVKMNRAYNTWLNYAHDLKIFFAVIPKNPETIDRNDCLTFMKQQRHVGRSEATINRRLAAVSSLFQELQLLGITLSNQNPVQPEKAGTRQHRHSQSLYQRQPQRLPDIIGEKDLQRFFSVLPTWRDRTLMLLMWVSCLRVSEAVAIHFEDIECSRRSICIRTSKGGQSRLVFMEPLTFAALNRYLDEERGVLFPEVNAVFVAFKGQARGRPLSVNAVQKLVTYYAQKSGLPHLHPHLFRHTGITQLVRHKMLEPALRELVGHHHPDSLLPYLHLGDDFVETEFERVQAIFGTTNWLRTSLSGDKS